MFRGNKPLTTKNASKKSDVSAARALETDEQLPSVGILIERQES